MIEISPDKINKMMQHLFSSEKYLREDKKDDCSIELCKIHDILNAHLKRYENPK